MSDSIFDDKPISRPAPSLTPRIGILVISAFLVGACIGKFATAPFNHLMTAAGLIGLVSYLTSRVVQIRKFHQQDLERTTRTESRLEKHLTSHGATGIPAVDVNALQNRSATR